jgi:hypothetical protein
MAAAADAEIAAAEGYGLGQRLLRARFSQRHEDFCAIGSGPASVEALGEADELRAAGLQHQKIGARAAAHRGDESFLGLCKRLAGHCQKARDRAAKHHAARQSLRHCVLPHHSLPSATPPFGKNNVYEHYYFYAIKTLRAGYFCLIARFAGAGTFGISKPLPPPGAVFQIDGRERALLAL